VSAAADVEVHPDEPTLAAAIAGRLVRSLAQAQAARGTASVVLTGGGIGTAALAALATAPALDDVDWRRVEFWWGDERFLPSGDPERNETGARSALLDKVRVDPALVHPMPASDGPDGDDPEAAAARYAAALRAGFDVVLLGIGPEGHVASLFPGMPALHDDRPVVAVRDSPKPPPTRITLTFGPIRSAREVWILASGASKTDAVARALSGADPDDVPAAGAHGTERTMFLLDTTAAAGLPG
jgi:6-phosphogluconolactonase